MRYEKDAFRQYSDPAIYVHAFTGDRKCIFDQHQRRSILAIAPFDSPYKPQTEKDLSIPGRPPPMTIGDYIGDIDQGKV